MADNWKLVGLNHVNAIVDGYEATIEHFTERLGFDLNRRIPYGDDGTDACLMSLTDVMFEFFAPRERTERGQGGLLARYGDHYLGMEFQVPDVAVARKVAEDHSVRIINDPGTHFFTHPGSSFGVAFEIWSGNFHEHRREPSFWRDEHPLGLMGLGAVSIAVNDLDVGVARLTELTNVTPLGKVSRAPAKAEGASFRAGDIVVEMLAPTGDGPVADYLSQYGERIRSVVFKASDLGRVETHLTSQGFELVAGDADGALAINPAQNKNLLFEFTE